MNLIKKITRHLLASILIVGHIMPALAENELHVKPYCLTLYGITYQWFPITEYVKLDGLVETGLATYYNSGNLTAIGDIFDKNKLTAAHRTAPLPCMARVTNLENGRTVVVKINDRGPYAGFHKVAKYKQEGKYKRIIDLSERAAEVIGFNKRKGTTMVKIEFLSKESQLLGNTYKNRKMIINVVDQTPELINGSISKQTKKNIFVIINASSLNRVSKRKVFNMFKSNITVRDNSILIGPLKTLSDAEYIAILLKKMKVASVVRI